MGIVIKWDSFRKTLVANLNCSIQFSWETFPPLLFITRIRYFGCFQCHIAAVSVQVSKYLKALHNANILNVSSSYFYISLSLMPIHLHPYIHTSLGATSNTTLRILSVKGGGVPPKSVTHFLAKILSVKGEGGVPPISVTQFLDQKRCFWGQKTQFLALFKDIFSGECP